MTIDVDLNVKFKYMFRDEVFIKCNLSGLANQPALDANTNLLHILRGNSFLDTIAPSFQRSLSYQIYN